ncbi:hypothetical protein [uncultured Aeromicrobium sp.]|uniref:hypothetical protein n=1 Tax=uncultured Aeromicrobium sp. TaxID=337820 RepID=UPI0025D4DFB4|nr:hypothetical protein [uncultured Aeromicrobium sp.]
MSEIKKDVGDLIDRGDKALEAGASIIMNESEGITENVPLFEWYIRTTARRGISSGERPSYRAGGRMSPAEQTAQLKRLLGTVPTPG